MVWEFEMNGPLSGHPPAYAGEGRLAGVLRDMLAQSNGASAYGGAFVLLPSGRCDVCRTMEEVNAGAWKGAYPREVRDTWFFAVDVLGHPFGIEGERIVHLDLETGESRTVGSKLGEFLAAVRADPNAMVGLDRFEGWFEIGMTLGLGERLVPKVPAIMGGGQDASAFGAGDLMDVLEYHADLYRQVKDVPDGGKVLFVVR